MNNTNPQLYLDEINLIIKSFSCKDYLTCLKHFGYEPRYKKEKRIAYLYKNAGNIYKITDLLKSVECYNSAILYFEKIKNKSNIKKELAECYINSALIYYQLKNNVKSLELYKNGTELYKELKFNDKLLKYYENMSEIYILELQFNNSILYLNKILEILNDNEITHQIIQKKINITYKLSLIYVNNLNDIHKALELNLDLLNILKKNSSIEININYVKHLYYICLLYILLNNNYKAKEFINHMVLEYFSNRQKDYIILNNLITNIEKDQSLLKNNSNELIKICYEIKLDSKSDELIKSLIVKILG